IMMPGSEISADDTVCRTAVLFLNGVHEERRIIRPRCFVLLHQAREVVCSCTPMKNFRKLIRSFGTYPYPYECAVMLALVHPGRLFDDVFRVMLYIIVEFRSFTTGFHLQHRFICDDVAAASSMQFPDVDPCHAAGVSRDGIQIDDGIGGCEHRILPLFRLAACMGGNPFEADIHLRRRQESVVGCDEMILFDTDADMCCDEAVHIIDCPGLHHGDCTSRTFLCRL